MNKDYPNKKCPFCKKKKQLTKGWARFPDYRLQKRKEGVIPLSTGEAGREWFDFIVCFNCYRIIWHQLDPHGSLVDKIDLPTISKLTGWNEKELPYTPIVLYDKEGNPVYGTKRSREMYKTKSVRQGE